MRISTKAWAKYIRKLAAVDQKAADLMTAYIEERGMDDADELIRYAYALATKYGEAAAAAACEMYDATAAAQGASVPPAEPAPTATYGEVAKAVNGTKNISEKLVPQAVSRTVKMAGADTMLQNAERDGAQFAWVPMGDTCAFCITLASRGWQYMSKQALKGGHAEHIHANCDCQYAIRFDGKSGVAGYDPEKYRKMYYEAEGSTPAEKIRAMRRAQYADDPEKYLAPKREAYALEKLRKNDENSADGDIIELIEEGPVVSVLEALQDKKVMHKPVGKLESPLSEEEIIKRLHGRDTGGRCSSLAFAYAGNKNGLDVIDFRKDASVDIFSRPSVIRQITALAKGHVVQEYDDYTAVNTLLKNVKPGKEYIFSVAKHTAVVRKAQRGYEYLQLQRDIGYGFKRLTKAELKDTFGCCHSRTSYRVKLQSTSMLFDIGELKDDAVFQYLLGFINNQ